MTLSEKLQQILSQSEEAPAGPWKHATWTEQGEVVEAEVQAGGMSLSLSDVETQEDAWPKYLAAQKLMTESRVLVPALARALGVAVEALQKYEAIVSPELAAHCGASRALAEIEKLLEVK